jgi:hypothetical protein
LDWDEPAGLVARLDEAGDQLKVAKTRSAFLAI